MYMYVICVCGRMFVLSYKNTAHRIYHSKILQPMELHHHALVCLTVLCLIAGYCSGERVPSKLSFW